MSYDYHRRKPVSPPQPHVTRIPPASRRRRRGLPAWAVGLLIVLGVASAIVIPVWISIRQANAPQEIPVARVEYVTATPYPTPLLPLEYILALSATPSPVIIPTQPAGGPAFITATPAFSVQASKIVFVCYLDGSDEICTMNGDGSNVQRLTNQRGTDWYPSFSPDLQQIVFSTQRSGNFDIFIMNADGSNVRQLTRNHDHNYAPSISPDGNWIVFTSTYGNGGDQNIWLMSIDGEFVTQLTFDDTDDVDPMWSPDGRMISFTSGRSGSTELFVMNADGANVQQVTANANVGGRNDWSPDMRYLTFYAGRGKNLNIYLVSFDCTLQTRGCTLDQMTRLTNGGNNKGPSFSPDGQWIVYASEIDGDNEIWIMRMDGSEKQQLTFNSSPDWQPRWRP